jgi:hypothetical protein
MAGSVVRVSAFGEDAFGAGELFSEGEVGGDVLVGERLAELYGA